MYIKMELILFFLCFSFVIFLWTFLIQWAKEIGSSFYAQGSFVILQIS